MDHYPRGKRGFPTATGQRSERVDARAEPYVDTPGAGCGLEAFDDGLGLVGGRKHATVGLGLERNTAVLKPADGVGRLEAREGSQQGPGAARVAVRERAGFEAGVWDVTAAAARDADLGKRLRSALEQEYPRAGAGLGGGDRAEVAGGAATND